MKNNKKKLALLAILFAMCVSILVPMNAQAASKKKIKLNKTKVQLVKGTKYQLKLKDKNGKTISYKSIKFSSKNKKIATVNKKGKITAKKNGTTYIYAKYKGKKYKCKVVVFTAEIKTNIAVGTYKEGRSGVTMRPVLFRIKTSRTVPIKYKSLDISKAKVSSKGKVTFKSYDSMEAFDLFCERGLENINIVPIQITLGDSKVTKDVLYNGYSLITVTEGDEDDEFWKMCWNDERETYLSIVNKYDLHSTTIFEENFQKYAEEKNEYFYHESIKYYKYYYWKAAHEEGFDRNNPYKVFNIQNEKGEYLYYGISPKIEYTLVTWR